MTPYLLLFLAVTLAWPVPILLSRAKWPAHAPVPAMFLWQAVGLSGGMALVTAPIVWGIRNWGDGIIPALQEIIHTWSSHDVVTVFSDDRWGLLGLAAVSVGLLIFGHLALILVASTVTTYRRRTQHREIIRLLSEDPHQADHALFARFNQQQIRVLPHTQPLAFCLPGFTRSMTVISQGLLDQVEPQQLSAVIEHEKAHLQQRHDLLRLAFEAWAKAMAWLPTSRMALAEVISLTEILADQYALKTTSRKSLIQALVLMAEDSQPQQPAHSPARSTNHLPDVMAPPINSARIDQLTYPDQQLGTLTQTGIFSGSLLLVILPAAASLWGVLGFT